jgi:hypothetical protein
VGPPLRRLPLLDQRRDDLAAAELPLGEGS